ncbi:NADPH-dependent FMN reductase [Luteolibacter sp. AS25]|uniref:NADPH-dependent FMN reductase n=1 Tax=Luteolibacter sp. AS25 TaxID=3135776 RepID=UPI00398BB7A2
MRKILAIGASTSSSSINRKLAAHAASLLEGVEVEVLDLNDFSMPLYSEDLEKSGGVHPQAKGFIEKVAAADGVIISMAEHNGSYSAAFKNTYDWASRCEQKVWAGKPMLLMATSPGGRGGMTAPAAAEEKFPRMGGELVATFSLPSFHENFSEDDGITENALAADLKAAVEKFGKAIRMIAS